MALSLSQRNLTQSDQLEESYQETLHLLPEFSKRRACGRGHVFCLMLAWSPGVVLLQDLTSKSLSHQRLCQILSLLAQLPHALSTP